MLQWQKTHAADWHAKMLENALIFVVPGVALLTPWMQKSFKIVENSSKNHHKKYEARYCNDQIQDFCVFFDVCIFFQKFFVKLLFGGLQAVSLSNSAYLGQNHPGGFILTSNGPNFNGFMAKPIFLQGKRKACALRSPGGGAPRYGGAILDNSDMI